LIKLVDNEKEIIPFLKTLSDKEKKAVKPPVKKYINGLDEKKLKGRKKYLVEQLGFFFLTFNETIDVQDTLYEMAYEMPPSILDMLSFYKPLRAHF